jgi:hypothetical protein
MRARCSRRAFTVAGTAAVATLLTRRAGAATPKSILLVGDSMIAGGLGLYMQRDLDKVHGYDTRRHGKTSSGLARPDFYDWMKVGKEIVDKAGPTDATIAMFGGNDVQGLYMGHGAWIRWPEAGWAEEYARRVNAFADIVAPDHRTLFWIGMPVMRPEKFHRKVQRVNTIYRAEMAIRPHAHYVDIWPLLADENGDYADRIQLEPDPDETKGETKGEIKPKKVRVRAGDGIHLSPAGARFVADHVMAVVDAELRGEA